LLDGLFGAGLGEALGVGKRVDRPLCESWRAVLKAISPAMAIGNRTKDAIKIHQNRLNENDRGVVGGNEVP
jgi:hypothetical protein